jgi:septal ring-binding cell division protein DamX
LALLVYLVSDPSPTEDAKKTVSPPPATTSNPDRAGTVLLQALVDEADWSLLRIAGFQRLWSALSAPAREEAMRSLALRRLADRLRAQVLELRALANLNHDPNLATALAPLHALAETLRLTEEAKLASAGASLRPIRTGPAPAIAAPAVPPAIAAPAKPATAKAVVRPTNHTALLAAGEAWLANLHQDKQTIQLISLQHLDNILQILTAHPKVNAQIIRNHGPGAPYRVLMGEFDTVALAEQAIRALPEDLRRQLGQPIVRAVAAARKDATRKDAPRIGSGAVKK